MCIRDSLKVEREVLQSGQVLPLSSAEEDYEVLMIQQDGLWRVEQWRRRIPIEETSAQPVDR